MAIDVNTAIIDLRNHLGVDSSDPGFDDAGCLLLLNKSFWEILNKFNFREKETSYTFTTVASTPSYTVPTTFEALTLISIEDLNTAQHTPLNRISILGYENEYVNKTETESKPTSYFRYNDKLWLWPTPNNVYTITVYHLLELSDLTANAAISIPREWDEIIISGAIYRGYKMLGDYMRAKAARADQIEVINATVPVESKEEANSPLAGLSFMGYDTL